MAYNTALFQPGWHHARVPTTRDEQLAVAKQIRARTGQYGFSPGAGKDRRRVPGRRPSSRRARQRAVFNSPAHVALIAKFADAYKAGGLLKDKLFSEDQPPGIDRCLQVRPDGDAGSAAERIDRAFATTRRTCSQSPMSRRCRSEGRGSPPAAGCSTSRCRADTTGRVATEAARVREVPDQRSINQLDFAKLAGAFPTAKRRPRTRTSSGMPKRRRRVRQGDGDRCRSSMDVVRTLYVAGVPGFERLNKRLQDAVEAAIIGRRDIKTALDDAAAFWNSKLKP